MTTVLPDDAPSDDEPGGEPGADDDPAMVELRQQVLDGIAAMTLPETGSVTGNKATGEVTIAMTPNPVTLPRPTFGQIRTLIRAEEHLETRLGNLTFRSTAYLNKFRNDTKPLQGDAGEGNLTLSMDTIPTLERLRDESRDQADQIEDERDAEIIAWWTLVLSTLASDAAAVTEESWPADLIDPSLPGRVVAHWRRNPVGPG